MLLNLQHQDWRLRLPSGDPELQLRLKLTELRLRVLSGDQECRLSWLLLAWQLSKQCVDQESKLRWLLRVLCADRELRLRLRHQDSEDSITPTSDDCLRIFISSNFTRIFITSMYINSAYLNPVDRSKRIITQYVENT